MPFTDMCNAQRFAWEHQADLRYISKWRHWIVWDGRRWHEDETGKVQDKAKATVRRLYEAADAIQDPTTRARQVAFAMAAQSAKRIGGMIELAKSEPGIPVTPEQLDADPWLLNVQNGTIDLRTGQLRDHRPEDLITKIAPVFYDAKASCPTWEAF